MAEQVFKVTIQGGLAEEKEVEVPVLEDIIRDNLEEAYPDAGDETIIVEEVPGV